MFFGYLTFIKVKANLVAIDPSLNIFMGSGREYAHDFMIEGHDPTTAIKMTAVLDPFTNDLVHEITV
jgi:hypothetical protein